MPFLAGTRAEAASLATLTPMKVGSLAGPIRARFWLGEVGSLAAISQP